MRKLEPSSLVLEGGTAGLTDRPRNLQCAGDAAETHLGGKRIVVPREKKQNPGGLSLHDTRKYYKIK